MDRRNEAHREGPTSQTCRIYILQLKQRVFAIIGSAHCFRYVVMYYFMEQTYIRPVLSIFILNKPLELIFKLVIRPHTTFKDRTISKGPASTKVPS